MRTRAQRTTRAGLGIGLGLLMLALAAPAATAQTIEPAGEFNDWWAFTLQEGSNPVCFIYSTSKSKRPDNFTRNDPYIQVTHRPSSKAVGEISITMGYAPKKDSVVTVDIDGGKTNLFVDNQTAWAETSDIDAKLVQSMIRGVRMTVTGTASDGTQTSDSYSLSGFTAAYRKIGELCGVR